jgi:photosystem II stability/assembly factor-like uncharacterized protein
MYFQGWSEDGTSAPGELSLRYPGWDTIECPEGYCVRRLLRASDGSLYAGEDEGSIFRSTDSGVTWDKVGSLPDGVHIYGMIQSSSFPDHSFYVADFQKVWKSFDACTTWFETGAMPLKASSLCDIVQAGGTIYVGGRQEQHSGQSAQIFKTTNMGVTWDTTAWPPVGCTRIRALLRGIDGRIYAAGSEGGCVFRTTNGGLSWQGVSLIGPMFPLDLAQTADSAVYLGTDGYFFGHVWKSTDHGATWCNIDSFPSLYMTTCVLAASDGSVYVGGGPQAVPDPRIYRSTDGGNAWVQTGDIGDTVGAPWDLLELPDGTILAGGIYRDKAYIWRLTKPYGWVTSSVFDAGEVPEYGTAAWSFTTQGDSPVVKVRTDTLPDMSTAPDWDLCPAATDGEDISFLSSVHDGQRYIQYRVEMRGWSNFSTPVFHEIGIEYTPTGITEQWRRLRSGAPALTISPSVFRKQVTLSFSVPESSHLEVRIFDIAGRPVRTLLDERVSSGEDYVIWDGTDNLGKELSSGVYFCSLRCFPDFWNGSLIEKAVYLGR